MRVYREEVVYLYHYPAGGSCWCEIYQIRIYQYTIVPRTLTNIRNLSCAPLLNHHCYYASSSRVSDHWNGLSNDNVVPPYLLSDPRYGEPYAESCSEVHLHSYYHYI